MMHGHFHVHTHKFFLFLSLLSLSTVYHFSLPSLPICTYLYFPAFLMCSVYVNYYPLYNISSFVFSNFYIQILFLIFSVSGPLYAFSILLCSSVIIQCSQKSKRSRIGVDFGVCSTQTGLLSGQSGVTCSWEKHEMWTV
jgi:hypothetical protein